MTIPKPVAISPISHQTIKLSFENAGTVANIQFQVSITPDQALDLVNVLKVPCSVTFSQIQSSFLEAVT